MLQQHKHHTEMGVQLNESCKLMETLGNERKTSKVNDVSSTRRWFRGRFILTIFILLGFLGTGSMLYGQDTNYALNIDENGNVGIGTNEPKAKLDVAGKVKADDFTTKDSLSLSQVSLTIRRLNDDVAAIKKFADILNSQIPIGTIMAYGGDTTNTAIKKQLEEKGWLPCNGDFISINQYKELHDVIGNAFGWNNTDKFNLPDMRGRFLRGVDQGQKRDPDADSRQQAAANGNAGDKIGSIQNDIFGRHYHQYTIFPNDRGNIASGRYWRQGQANTTETGGNETRPKNIYVNWIIKVKNILPYPLFPPPN